MKKNLFLCALFGLIVVAFSGVAKADILDFEGLIEHLPQGNTGVVSNGYGGLNWVNMNLIDPTGWLDGNTGYHHGIISGSCVALNAGERRAIASSISTDFNFIGAWFTSAWYDNNILTVDGFRDGSLVNTTQLILNTSTPQWLNANFINIDELHFSTTHAQFAMDDFTYTPTPIPAAFFLFITGLTGLGIINRRKKKKLLI